MPIDTSFFDDMPTDLRDAIAKPIGDYETSRIALPSGHYFGECYDVVKGNSRNKGSLYFAFLCRPTEVVPQQPNAGAIEKALKEAGADLDDFSFPTERSLGGMIPAGQIWPGTPGGRDMAREWFSTMGFPLAKPFDQCIIEMKGKKVLMEIGKDSYTNAQGEKREFSVMASLKQDPR
jgi:hypothetical protein